MKNIITNRLRALPKGLPLHFLVKGKVLHKTWDFEDDIEGIIGEIQLEIFHAVHTKEYAYNKTLP